MYYKQMDPGLAAAMLFIIEQRRKAAIEKQKEKTEYLPPLALANAQRATPL